jgi:hypothetical protein
MAMDGLYGALAGGGAAPDAPAPDAGPSGPEGMLTLSIKALMEYLKYENDHTLKAKVSQCLYILQQTLASKQGQGAQDASAAVAQSPGVGPA